jgi:hypothetical protein
VVDKASVILLTVRSDAATMSINLQACTASDGSIGLWDTFDDDDNLLNNDDRRQSMIDDVVADDLLMMEVEVELDDHASLGVAGANDDTWGLTDDAGDDMHCAIKTLPSFDDHDEDDEDDEDDEGDEDDEDDEDDDVVDDECSEDEDYDDDVDDNDEDDETPRTPSQVDRQVFMFDSENIHEITPEHQAPPKINIPDLAELQVKCQRTLKKLANSMRRSDETRSIVKRQRLHSTAFKENECDDDFFSSRHASAMEESRRRLYQMINMGVSSTIDSRFSVL